MDIGFVILNILGLLILVSVIFYMQRRHVSFLATDRGFAAAKSVS
jgi:hypothetical protein